MDRCALAYEYHKQQYNCCQCVLAAFSDLTGLPEQTALDIGGGFGGGAGTKELCGAITGAVMVLGLLTPMDPKDPMAGKKASVRQARELQKRFREKFGALRCGDLLKVPSVPSVGTPAAVRLGITAHCDLMIVTAVEIVEELLAERA